MEQPVYLLVIFVYLPRRYMKPLHYRQSYLTYTRSFQPNESGTSNAAGGDVILYTAMRGKSPPGTPEFGVLLQAIGGALGLKVAYPVNGAPADPSGKAPNIPFAYDSIAWSLSSLKADPNLVSSLTGPGILDIQAIQYLYGANMTTGLGDQTYRLNKLDFKTIWDPNGTNTLSGEGVAEAQIINLGQAGFSTSGGKYTAAIAYGTKMSNATGGSGNDILIGNSGDNLLTGGAGNDSLQGGGGSDTAVYSGLRSQYQITQSGSKIIIRDLALNRDGTDTLTGVAFAQFADGRVSASPSYDPIGIAIADQLSVVYFGRGVSAEWRNATSTVVANGASPELLKSFFTLAVTDRAFGATDSVQTLTNKTFNNIFGVNASTFEQNAWADTVAKGYVTKEALPWAMFNSYLAADNVPPEYKIPAQSRIIAVNAFTNSVTGAADTALGSPGSASADAARAWLVPIRNQTDAYFKVQGAGSSVLSIAGVKSGGPLEPVEAAPLGLNDSLPLIGVSEGVSGLGI
jgi:Ca2+-binding RTX toxin-like protein